MKMSKNKPLKSFEIVYQGTWYFVEIFSTAKVEVYTENKEDIDEEQIKYLIKYLKVEGFFDDLTDK